MVSLPLRYPLSPVQHGMLLHSLFDPDSGIYIQQLICHFREKIDSAVFIETWRTQTARHAILRTSLHWQDSTTPYQRIHSAPTLDFAQLDHTHIAPSRQESALDNFLEIDRTRGFTLDRAPLSRHTLIDQGGGNTCWVWTSHHAIMDGRSRLLLLQETFAIYADTLAGRDSRLPAPPEFHRYIDWLQGRSKKAATDFWTKHLAGIDSTTPLGVDRNVQRNAIPSTPPHDEQSLLLSADATDRLVQVAQENEVTPYIYFLGAWAILLSRYSGEQDVVVGATRAGRNTDFDGAPTMIGIMIHTVPMRISVRPDLLLSDWLGQLQGKWRNMREHEHASLVDIHRCSNVPPEQPLFESLLSFENYDLSDALMTQQPSELNGDFTLKGETNYPLEISGVLGPELTLTVSYDTTRFEHETINRLLRHLSTLLESMVGNSQQPARELQILSTAESSEQLNKWNGTVIDGPAAGSVKEIFESQVLSTPNVPALVFADSQLTYSELNNRANQLAHHLRSLGVTTETRVGLLLNRSLELGVGVLGILKAGGAYVPLDPNHPQARLAYVLQDAGLDCIVTLSGLVERLPPTDSAMVCLDDYLDKDGEQSPRDNPLSEINPTNLAYVIYTSGSTGQPKGVQVEHAAVVNQLRAMAHELKVQPTDRLLSVTTPTFDLFVQDLLLPLTHGASVRVAAQDLVANPEELIAHLAANEETLMLGTATTWEMLVNNGWGGNPALRIQTGGEPLSSKLAEDLLQRSAGLWNSYGPTETTITATMLRVKPSDTPGLIGRPLANNQVYLLDRNGQLVPVGVPGELHIGGMGLARGYLNRPDLTAERFIKHPFSSDPNARLYRTGDQCRWHVDGQLEFIGRLDDQIKLRGFRIEPGEIEAALRAYPGVAQAVVILREDREGDRRLVGYYTTGKDQEPVADELRDHLRARLPDYMIPAAFVHLDRMPLTSSGKTDRQTLPAPDDSRPNLATDFVAPSGPVEQQLAKIWCDVLNIEHVGVNDNFIALGGHSLMAIRLKNRIDTAFEADIPLRELFERPTIAEIADAIISEQGSQQSALQTMPAPIDRADIGALPLSFPQRSLWLLTQLEEELTAYHITQNLQIDGPLNTEALRLSLDEIVRRHEPLRTTFGLFDEEPQQRINAVESINLEVRDLRTLPPIELEDEINAHSKREAERSFNLSHDLMLRASLLQLDDHRHVLVLTMHHIASDGRSLRVFAEELESLYRGFSRGTPSALPHSRLSYVDYCVWQHRQLRGKQLQQMLQFWRKDLEHLTPLAMPYDYSRPEIRRFRGARHNFELSPALTERLGDLAQSTGATLHITLLAVFQALLARYCQQDDVAVIVPVDGRDHPELESLIGHFVNTLVIRTDLAESPTIRQLIAKVRDTSLAAYEHRAMPFETLVKELHPERLWDRNPLSQVMFQLFAAPEQTLQLDGLEVTPRLSQAHHARFDLECQIRPNGRALHGTFTYDTELFKPASIERMSGHFNKLLERVTDNPDESVELLGLLTETEEHQQLVDWNTTATVPPSACVHELFELQAKRSPDSIALIFGEEELSYGRLNDRANQLAHHLASLSLGPEALIGICLERSPNVVIAILGILKCGYAYVPLDVDHPQERLSFTLADSKLQCLVTDQEFLTDSAPPNVSVTNLEAEQAQLAHQPVTNPALSISPDQLVYVMYTSGSTGRPKGVEVAHRAVVNVLTSTARQIECVDTDLLLSITTPTFDISVLELLMPLVVGARVEVLPKEVALDPIELSAALRASRPTIMQATPTTWTSLIDSGWRGDTQLRAVCGGEALSENLAEALRRRTAALWNMYGPTEATIYATATQIIGEGRPGSIGRPIENTQVYLLDRNGQLVPVGVPGELHIGGMGLARGYLNRPDLTAERFIKHPFSSDPNARLYRTGDQCRWHVDGQLEFIGRLDDQIKLRGFRIEPGEIEAALRAYPGVAQAVVILREDREGDRRLVGYYTTGKDQEPVADELRDHLRARLPDYMIPAAFVHLDRMPLTSSGKTDRQTLPAPDDSRPNLATDFVAPSGPVEQQLAKIWCDVLNIEHVGVNDNFFDLGGSSLLAVQLASKTRSILATDFSLRTLFQHPTIQGLATALADNATRPDADRDNQRVRTASDLAQEGPTMEERPKGSEPAHTTFEHRPLWSLIATGKIKPVDSVAIGYISEQMLRLSGLSGKTAIEDWYDSTPTLEGIYDTLLGRIGIIVLPVLDSELYDDQSILVEHIIDAMQLSHQIGARAVSLTGLLPSATDYGRAVASAQSALSESPTLTTGHATTVSVMTMTIENLLFRSGRNLTDETVAFLGLGSIGYTNLRSMLQLLPHPRRILICDVFSKKSWLDEVAQAIVSDLGFKGKLEFTLAREELPAELYTASLIVGATNVPNILDVGRLKPGTLIVDDSAPHCFSTSDAVNRAEKQKDILFTEGGVVRLSSAWHHTRYLPHRIERAIQGSYLHAQRQRNPYQIGGCVLSSLMSAGEPPAPPTIGVADDEKCLAHYAGLRSIGCSAATVHCDGYVPSDHAIKHFRDSFGVS